MKENKKFYKYGKKSSNSTKEKTIKTSEISI